MCGILAVFGRITDDLVGKFPAALDLMKHRGPDDHGIKKGNRFLLGHRRLSIQDTRHSAAQPMFSADGKVSIIFNGEIYNFKELREKLTKKGFQFRTRSDTEVILNLYIDKGEAFINDCNGMFSLIIVDESSQDTQVLVYRDRLGIKPLFYSKIDGNLFFASEIKSILYLSDRKFRLSEEAVSSYLSFRYPICNKTFFEGIAVVPPGHFMRIKQNKIVKMATYWQLSDTLDSHSLIAEEQDCLDQLEEVFSSAVSYRTIADVPVGAYLSGGVDSSLITAKMALQGSGSVRTYTSGFGEKTYNEFEFAKRVAEQYKTTHTELTVNLESYFETMAKLIEIKDAPLSVPNEVPLYLMSKELKKDITVVLSGEGADESFGGYGRIFRSADDYRKFKSGAHSSEFIEAFRKKYGPAGFDSELDHFYWSYCYLKPEAKENLLNKQLQWADIEGSLKGEFKRRFDEVPQLSYPEKMMYAFETVHLQGLLNRLDTTTMAASVEGRVPFVDHRLVELAFRIPVEWKLKWKSEAARKEGNSLLADQISENYDIPKYILKKYGERYLSDEILHRRKMGFPVPLDTWFGGGFDQFVNTVIDDHSNPVSNLFDLDAVKQFLSSGIKIHSDALKAWMLLSLFVFCKKYERYLK